MSKPISAPAPKKRLLLAGKALPTGQEIYDRLMKNIEPELVIRNLKELDAPYKKETVARRKARYARYAKAFKEYRKQYKAWIKQLNLKIQNYKRAVIKASEKMSKTSDASALADLEAQMKAA